MLIFNFSIYKCLKKTKKVVPTLQLEVKLKVDIVTSDDIKIYQTGKFQDFTARYIIKFFKLSSISTSPEIVVCRFIQHETVQNLTPDKVSV